MSRKDLTASIREGAGIKINNYYNQNKEEVERFSVDKGKVKYNIPQTELVNNLINISANSIKGLLVSPGEEAENIAMKELLSKNPEENKVLQENKKILDKKINLSSSYFEEIKRLKNEGQGLIAPETSTIQSFTAGSIYAVGRQLVDPRQYPGLILANALGAKAAATVGTSLLGSLSKTGASKATEAAFKTFGRIVGAGTEEGVEEFTDQLATGDTINAKEIFYAAVGGAVIGGAVSIGAKPLGKIIDKTKKGTPDVKIDLETENLKQVKKAEDLKTDIQTMQSEDLKVTAEGLEGVTEAKGKIIPKKVLIEKCTEIEGITVQEAREIYGPIVAKRLLSDFSDEIPDLKTFRSISKKNPGKLKSMLEEILTDPKRNLTPEEVKSFEWGTKILDNKRIKGINFSTRNFEDSLYQAIDGTREYVPMYSEVDFKVPGKDIDFASYKNNADLRFEYNQAKAEPVKHDYKKFKKKPLQQRLKKDLAIPPGAKVKSVNGNVARIKNMEGKSITRNVADIEYEYGGKTYYVKATEIDGKFEGKKHSYFTDKKVINEKGETVTKKPKFITPVKNYNVKMGPGKFNPGFEALEVLKRTYPDQFKIDEEIIQKAYKKPDEMYVDILDILSDETIKLMPHQVTSLNQMAKMLDDITMPKSKPINFKDTKIKINKNNNPAVYPAPKQDTLATMTVEMFKEMVPGINTREDFINWATQDFDRSAQTILDMLTDPDIPITPLEKEALETSYYLFKKPNLKDFPIKGRGNKRGWGEFHFKNEVKKDFVPEKPKNLNEEIFGKAKETRVTQSEVEFMVDKIVAEPKTEAPEVSGNVLTPEKFYENFTDIKTNYKDYTSEEAILLAKDFLKQSGINPADASDIKVRAKKIRTPYESAVGLSKYDEIQWTRTKWLEEGSEIRISYIKDGELNLMKVSAEADPKLEPQIENYVLGAGADGDNHAVKYLRRLGYSDKKIDMSKFRKAATKKVKAKLGLGEQKVDTGLVKNKMEQMLKEVGTRIKNKYNIKNVADMEKLYKEKYKIDFEVVEVPAFLQGEGRIAELGIFKEDDNGIKYVVQVLKDIKDEDLRMGAVRHELEHLRDYVKDPDFIPRTPKLEKKANIGETIEGGYAGHFEQYPDNSFEYSYILNNEIENIMKDEKPNLTVIRRLGLDIPDVMDEEGKKFVKNIIKETEGMEGANRMDVLRKETSKHFRMKNNLKSILYSKYSPSKKAAMGKEYLRTQILNPFQKSEEAMKNTLLENLQIDINGHQLGVEQILDLFEENNGDLADYLLYGKNLPKVLKEHEGDFLDIRNKLGETINTLAEDGVSKPSDIINSICYDSRNTIENLLTDEEIRANLDVKNNLDVEKLTRGEVATDELTGLDTTKELLNIRDRFAETNYKYFNDSKQELLEKIKNGKSSGENVLSALKRAKRITEPEELKNIFLSNELDKIPEVEEFLHNHPGFFSYNLADVDIEAATIKSKKDTAKLFFNDDMRSIKGDDRNNPGLGTYAHKLSRFVYAESEGQINPASVSDFVRNNKISQRLVFKKVLHDVPAAHAIKETFPDKGYNGFASVLNAIQATSVNPQTKTFNKELKSFLDANLGEKLGRVTKPVRGGLDRFFDRGIRSMNEVNLTGPKALKELVQEPMGMVRDQMLLYGGTGFLKTYGELIKSIVTIIRGGSTLDSINKSIGNMEGSIPLEMYNIIQEDLGDLTGYTKHRIMKYGSSKDRVFYNMDKGLEKVNMYKFTQQWLKLTAFKNASDILNKQAKYSTLSEMFQKELPYVKRVYSDLGIDENQFKFLKELQDMKSIKENNVFDKKEFSSILTKEKMEEVYDRVLSSEEYDLLKNDVVNNFENLYDKVVKDISPTETTGATRSVIENIEDPVYRNFARLTGNFKNSIQEQWRRMYKSYYLSNVTEDTGKFDWRNTAYQKRLLSNFLQTGIGVGLIVTAADKDFYVDPIEAISDKIDSLIENPASALWSAVEDQTNLWGLTTGANVVRRPIQLINQTSRGKYKEAGETLLKTGLNNYNYKLLKGVYDYVD